jgi:hypothetical protein
MSIVCFDRDGACQQPTAKRQASDTGLLVSHRQHDAVDYDVTHRNDHAVPRLSAWLAVAEIRAQHSSGDLF